MSRYFPRTSQELLEWYQRYISPLSLIAGFLSDNFILLKRVDLFQTNALLFVYLVLGACGIIFLNLETSGRIKSARVRSWAPLVLIAMQFSFGGLFSGFLSLYSRSASLAVSWIFVFALAALLFGNERFMRFYSRFTFQLSMYFGVLFSFLIFFLPVIFREIGTGVFVAGGLTSLVFITGFLLLLSYIVPDVVKTNLTRTARVIVLIYITINVLYFNNLIPPLPLALKSAGVYHSVVHKGAAYALVGEPLPWYEEYLNYNVIYHKRPGENVYVYTAIFAPSGLSTTILHQWQQYDALAKEWKTTDTVTYPINGGADGGYRGYTYKYDPAPGRWRVNVITGYGQIIGRVSFTVVAASTTPELVTINT